MKTFGASIDWPGRLEPGVRIIGVVVCDELAVSAVVILVW